MVRNTNPNHLDNYHVIQRVSNPFNFILGIEQPWIQTPVKQCECGSCGLLDSERGVFAVNKLDLLAGQMVSTGYFSSIIIFIHEESTYYFRFRFTTPLTVRIRFIISPNTRNLSLHVTSELRFVPPQAKKVKSLSRVPI